MAEAGFQIGSRTYPFPASFRLGDPVLVEELTGLSWTEFMERVGDEDEEDDSPGDPVTLLGFLGVSVSQQNPTWRRDRVVRYVQALDMEAIQFHAPEEAEEESPPEEVAGEKSSETSAPSLKSVDTDSENSSQNSSGTQDSVIGSPV